MIFLLTLPNTFIQLRTDAEKHSLVESGLSWYSEDSKSSNKLSSSSYDTGSLKTEAQSKWRKKTLSLNEESGVKGNLRKPLSLSQPGSFRKSRHPPVGVTCPITHTSQSTLKVAGKNRGFFHSISILFQPLGTAVWTNLFIEVLCNSMDIITFTDAQSRMLELH